MSKVFKPKSVWDRFKNDERGNMALTFALTTVVVAGGMGAAMDFSTLSNAQKRSQGIADTIALSAAIYIKNNNQPPKNANEGYIPGSYSAAELGYEYKGWIDGDVGIDIVYDDSGKEARVTVSGKTIPTFMQILGKKDMNFIAESTVSYLEIDEKFPASIAMVLDNSGSMGWDDTLAENVADDPWGYSYAFGDSPAGAQARIDGLEDSVDDFVTDLEDRLGAETDAVQRTLRWGLLPYSSTTISDNQIDMQWEYPTTSQIEDMEPSGSTNSQPPMETARDWMALEEAAHRAEATRTEQPFKEPLKFVIFMSDGQNTVGNYEFIPDDEAPGYWKYNGWSWSYLSVEEYDNEAGYTRGHRRRDSDRLTIDACTAMKNNGVQIFTIGYALEVGAYNERIRGYGRDRWARWVHPEYQANAYALLQGCASKSDNFIKANDSDALDAAFDQIQNAIVEELIRIKM